MPIFDTHIIVDWSARSSPSPARPSGDAIWWAVARDGRVEDPVYMRTRAAAIAGLADLLAAEVAAGRRVLVGFDFPFGYPRGVAKRLTGQADALALWDWIAARVVDGADNANNRYAVATEINAAFDGVGPAWGRPADWDYPAIPVTQKARSGSDHPPERRLADGAAAGAKTVWQLAYAGSVGSQVLLGLPALKRLREDPRLGHDLSVWPFEGGFSVPETPVVVAEVYPSLLQDQVHARRQEDEVLDACQVRTMAEAFARLDGADGLKALFAEPTGLGKAERSVVECEEAWILGLGHEASLGDVLPRCARARVSPPHLQKPSAIYERSFQIIRAEADLSAIPPDLHDIAIRVIHACGMVDVAGSLVFSDDVGSAVRTALRRGAPILCDCKMVASGIIRRALPDDVEVHAMIDHPRAPTRAAELGTTRSAAAVELHRAALDGAIVVVGNAPTALFHLLDMLEDGAPAPAAILGFPVGFVGAAESKETLARAQRGVPFLTLAGRRGGSAMASAAINGALLGLNGDGT